MALISIIVPVYKVEQFLPRCVESILKQDFTDYELILVDDGSPDNCGKMCDEYAEKYSNIIALHRENGGLSAARNTGIDWMFENSSSEYVTFIDSDDWVSGDYLSSLVNALKNLNAEISTGQFKVIDKQSDAKELSDIKPKLCEINDFYEDESFDPNSVCGRLFRRSLFQNIRFPVGKLHEDRFVTYRLYFQCDYVAAFRKPMYFYFVNNDGIIHSEWSLRKLDVLTAAEEQLEFFSKNGFERAYFYTKKDYLHLLVYSIKNLKRLYPGEKKRIKEVRKKLRDAMKHDYDELNLTEEDKRTHYKYAYPMKFKIKRRLKGD